MGISAYGIVLLALTLPIARPAFAQTPVVPATPVKPEPPRPAAVPSPEARPPGTSAQGAKTPDIRLVGVILNEGTAPVALIETPRPQRQALYRVGDTVGEARIEQILEDRAIVRYRGEQVVLRLAGSPAATPPATPTGPAPASGAPTASGPRDPNVDARLRELARRLRDNPNDTEASAEMGRLRAEQRPPPVSARDLAQSSAAPDVASAVPAEGGVRLTEVSEGGLLARLGLQSGDIVRSVNQLAVGPERSLSQALAEAAATGSERVRIELTRDGALTRQEHRLVP